MQKVNEWWNHGCLHVFNTGDRFSIEMDQMVIGVGLPRNNGERVGLLSLLGFWVFVGLPIRTLGVLFFQ